MGDIFTTRERHTLAPPQKLKPSEWAEEHRWLPSSVAAEPGKFRNARTPYMAGIIDAICEPDLQEIVVMKAAQIAYTTGLQTLIGWCIDQEPAPMLLVMPSQDESRKLVEENLRPLIETTPQLQTHLTDSPWDITKEGLKFDSMSVHLGWAGSPATLGRRACKYVFFDEVDKFTTFSGRDAAPIPLGRKRTSTYLHNGRVIIGSTPTTREGAVALAFEACGDKRRYSVPCPHCSEYQLLNFSQLIFDSPEIKAIDDKPKRADFIEATNAAYYQCVYCKQAIRDIHKPTMLKRGVWLSENQTIDKDGVVTGERPKAKAVGFQISALYSPWVSFSQFAAQFVRSIGNYGAMMEFRNQWCGEIFEDVATSFKVDDLRVQVKDAPKHGLVPKWAGVLISTVDVQKDRFYFVVRAWGKDKSQLIHFGEVPTFEDVKKMALNAPYQLDGGHGEFLKPMMLFIDSRYRTDEVYEFAQTDARIRPIVGVEGDATPTQLIRWTVLQSLGLQRGTINTHFYKDKLSTVRLDGSWLISDGVTEDYLKQLANEHKIMVKGKSVWRQVSSGAPNHYLDCETIQLAAADFVQTMVLPDEATLENHRKAQRDAQLSTRQQMLKQLPQSNSWLGNTKKWI